ncbi:MAG: hypothetical protein IT436_05010 [Phycisphaerales bacterium]|nr:hypothetical protein [Phycisphaerales bacterium]
MRQVAAIGVCLWLAAVACTVGLLHLSDYQVSIGDLPDYGLVFLGYAMVASLVARRCLDVSMIVVAMWGASVGFWGPRWLSLSESVLDRWAAVTQLPVVFQRDDFRASVAIAAAGLLTAALLYIPTRSSRVVLQTAAAGLGVAALDSLPFLQRWQDDAGVILWHAVVCAGLCSWMVQGAQRRAGGCCPRCGAEVRGLSSPVCPSCGAALASTAPREDALARVLQQRPI